MHRSIWSLVFFLVGCAQGDTFGVHLGDAGTDPGGATGGSGSIDGSAGTGGKGAGAGGTGSSAGGLAGAGGSVNGGGGSAAGGTSDGGAGHSNGTGGVAGGGASGGSDAMVPADSGTGGAGPSDCPGAVLDPNAPRATTHKIKDLTGTTTSSGQFGVGGTDLGIPVRQPNGKIAYIFGDTFDQDSASSTGWRSPVLLRSEPGLPAAGISFNGAAGGSYAKQLLAYTHTNQTTWIPSDALTIGKRMYLHYVVNQGLGNVQWTQIAYSDDNGENWTSSSARWEAHEDNDLRQSWTWARGCDGYVYTLSTKFITRDKAIILYRVPEGQILDRTAYEPWGWDGTQWAWGNPATVVLDGQFGEMSLRHVENKWVLAWFNAGSYEISIKVFDSPTSDLYNATTYNPIVGTDWCSENDTHVAQLYGGFIHPDSTLHDLHLIISQWNTSTGQCHTTLNAPYHAMEFVTSVN